MTILPNPNWNTAQKLTITLLALACVILLLISAHASPPGWDSYWHLRIGMDLALNGLSPYVDNYSFTYNGAPSGAPVLFQLGYFGLHYVFGEANGQFAFKAIVFLAIFGCMICWMRRVKAPFIAYLIILPAVVVALQFRAMARPELVSYVFALVALILYHRTRLQLNPRTMLPILLLIVIWVNYHSAIFAYIIFFGMFVDIGLRQLSERVGFRDWVNWGTWGLATVLVGFINRTFGHPAIGSTRFSPEWKAFIVEYVFPMKYLYNLSAYVLIAIALLTLLLAVRQRKVGYIIIMIVLANAAMTMSRMVSIWAIMTLAMFAHTLADAHQKPILPSTLKFRKALIMAPSVIVSLAMMFFSIQATRAFQRMDGNIGGRPPEHLVNYMLENNLEGNIFNQYRVGGYLLYKLSPQNRVYIDGRTNILYPLEHMKRYDAAIRQLATMFEEVDKWEFEYAVLLNQIRYAKFMFYSGYGLDFSDTSFSLYRRENSNFPLLGRLVAAPYCWSDDDSTKVLEQTNLARDILPADSFIGSLIEIASGYVTAEDRTRFLREFDLRNLKTLPGQRFYVYRALEHGLFKEALKMLSNFSNWEQKDTLAIALAYMKLGEFQRAATPVLQAVNTPREEIEHVDLIIQLALLENIRAHVELDQSAKDYAEMTALELGEEAIDPSNLNATTFCEEGLRNFYITN